MGEIDPESRDIGKTRPCIIIQSNEYNDIQDATVYVVPLSSSPMYNSRNDRLLGIKVNGKGSLLCLNKIKSVQRSQVENVITMCPEELMELLDEYLAKRLSINPRIVEVEKIVEIKTETLVPTSIKGEAVELDSADNEKYDEYRDYGIKFIKHKIDPDYILTLSIADCRNIVIIYEILGQEYFENSPGFVAKTFNLAIKRAKQRARNFSCPVLEITESY